MKKMGITGYYTYVDYSFDISYQVKKIISTSITQQILKKYEFPKIKSEILEILLMTDGKTPDLVVTKNSKTTRGKYLSYSLWLPYHKIVKSGKVDLNVFIDEVFDGLTQILTEYGVNENDVRKLQKNVKAEVVGNSEYDFVLSKSQAAMRKIIADRNTEKTKQKEMEII